MEYQHCRVFDYMLFLLKWDMGCLQIDPLEKRASVVEGSAMSQKVLFTWSSGKDSALALYELLEKGGSTVVSFLTTLTEDYDRISMHGVRRVLLEQQAQSLGFPLEKIFIPKEANNMIYESRMGEVLKRYKTAGISTVVFGDIFLSDLRTYREENLSRIAMNALFPLWGMSTTDLAERFIELGFAAIVTCVDGDVLDATFAGSLYNRDFLSRLPQEVDPCGENGEFHTFVFDGPLFSRRIRFEKGEVVLRDERFYFCDLIPLT